MDRNKSVPIAIVLIIVFAIVSVIQHGAYALDSDEDLTDGHDEGLRSTETITVVDDTVYIDYLITGIKGRISINVPEGSEIEYIRGENGPMQFSYSRNEIMLDDNSSILIMKLKTKDILTYNEGAKTLIYNPLFNNSKVIFNIPDSGVKEMYPEGKYSYMAGTYVLVFENTNGVIIIKMNRGRRFNLLLYTVFFMLAILGYFGYVHYGKRRRLSKVRILNDHEEKIMKLVIRNKQIAQYEIMRELQLNKSHLSKILKRLEFRGLIKRRNKGKVKIIELGDKIQ